MESAPSPKAIELEADLAEEKSTSIALEEWRLPVDRRVVVLMVARVLVATLTLGAVVLVHIASNQTSQLGGPFGWFVSGLLGSVYLTSLIYGFLLPRIRNVQAFVGTQIGFDIAVITLLVHVTGGAESGFASMYLLLMLAASAFGFSSRTLTITVTASLTSYVVVSVLGYLGILPALVGQAFLPWETTARAMTRALSFNVVAHVAAFLLANNLRQQAQMAASRAAWDRAAALDMAALAENIVRSLSSGLLTVDEQGTIVSVNAEAERILGTQGILLGRSLLDLMPPIIPILEKAGSGPIRRTEVVLDRVVSDPLGQVRSEQIFLGVSVSPLTDGEGRTRGRVVNFSDLTELKQKDLELKQSEHLAAVGRLAAGVAHEIRNPLAAISGSIELLASSMHTGQDNKKLMDVVIREVDRLNGMITELLDYARPHTPDMHEVDLNTLLDETVRVFANDPGHLNVRVRYESPLFLGSGEWPVAIKAIASGDWPIRSAPESLVRTGGMLPKSWIIRADPGQIRQVVWNLLRNGAQAMPTGGDLTVRILVAQGRIGFEVRDQGVGISPEEQGHLFEPFFTTKEGGSGLGLATVHRIVEDHGGRADVESEVGRGTVFKIWLPPSDA